MVCVEGRGVEPQTCGASGDGCAVWWIVWVYRRALSGVGVASSTSVAVVHTYLAPHTLVLVYVIFECVL